MTGLFRISCGNSNINCKCKLGEKRKKKRKEKLGCVTDSTNQEWKLSISFCGENLRCKVHTDPIRLRKNERRVQCSEVRIQSQGKKKRKEGKKRRDPMRQKLSVRRWRNLRPEKISPFSLAGTTPHLGDTAKPLRNSRDPITQFCRSFQQSTNYGYSRLL